MTLRVLGNGLQSTLRQAMWNFSRMRLRVLQNTNWGINNNNIWANVNQNNQPYNPSFGDVFRSENMGSTIEVARKRAPSNVVSNGNVSIVIKEFIILQDAIGKQLQAVQLKL